MAATVQQSYTPSVAELLFVLSESTKLAGLKEANKMPLIRLNLQDTFVGILGIRTKDHVSGTVCLGLDSEPTPTLFISSSDPSFLNHIKESTALLRAFASAAVRSDSVAVRRAQAELITYILRYSFRPYAAEYRQLRDQLQRDIDTVLVEEVVGDPKDSKGSSGSKPPSLRTEAKTWCEGLTLALAMVDKETPVSDTIEEMEKLLCWARARYFTPRLLEEETIHAHVDKYSEPPSAVDLLRCLDHIVRVVVPPNSLLAGQRKPDPSSLAWLNNLTIKRVEIPRSDVDSSFKGSIDPARLERWLSRLVYNPLINARISRAVRETIISADTVHDKWAGYVGEAPVHLAVTHLLDDIGPRLEAVRASEKPQDDQDPRTGPSLVACAASEKPEDDQDPRTHLSLVACAGTCLACIMCYEAMRWAYKLPLGALHLFPAAGAETTPHSPCRTVGRLTAPVEGKLKRLLSEAIKARVTAAILERTPRPIPLELREPRSKASQPSN